MELLLQNITEANPDTALLDYTVLCKRFRLDLLFQQGYNDYSYSVNS